MKQKTILITGTTKGIGKAIASHLLENGYRVIGIARSASPFSNPSYSHYSIDLSDLSLLEKELKSILKEHPVLDGLICNAGKGYFGNLEELSFKQIRSTLELNFLSQVYLIKTFLPILKKQENSDILFIGSEAALAGKRKGSIYCASKFALRGFTQALREECSSDSIRITLINPGMVKTEFFDVLSFKPGDHPSEHLLPEDIAKTVFLVLSSRQGTVFEEINLSPQKKKIIFS